MAQTDSPAPTDAELAILRTLWRAGPRRSARSRKSSPRSSPPAPANRTTAGYTTVLKFLQIMTEKGLVDRDESQRTHIYRAKPRRRQNPAPARARSARPRVRRLGPEARDAGALGQKSLPAGTRPDPRAARPPRGGTAMRIADFGLRIADLCGAGECGTGVSPVYGCGTGVSPVHRLSQVFPMLVGHGGQCRSRSSGGSAGRSCTFYGRAWPSLPCRRSCCSCCVVDRPLRVCRRLHGTDTDARCGHHDAAGCARAARRSSPATCPSYSRLLLTCQTSILPVRIDAAPCPHRSA